MKKVLLAFVVAISTLSGCASPQIVRQDATSVVVAVPENTNSWPFYHQDKAREVAAGSIANPVLVGAVRVKVGESVTSTQDVTRRDIGGQNNKPRVGELTTTANTTSVSDRYEYHLEYQSQAPVPSSGPGFTNVPPGGGTGNIQQTGGRSPMKPTDRQPSRPDLPTTNSAPGGFPSTGMPGTR